MPDTQLPEWEKLLSSAAHLQKVVPLDEQYDDWNRVRDICAHIAVSIIHPKL